MEYPKANVCWACRASHMACAISGSIRATTFRLAHERHRCAPQLYMIVCASALLQGSADSGCRKYRRCREGRQWSIHLTNNLSSMTAPAYCCFLVGLMRLVFLVGLMDGSKDPAVPAYEHISMRIFVRIVRQPISQSAGPAAAATVACSSSNSTSRSKDSSGHQHQRRWQHQHQPRILNM